MRRWMLVVLGCLLQMACGGGGGGGSAGSGSATGGSSTSASTPSPPPAASIVDSTLLDFPRVVCCALYNPIVAVNDRNHAMIAYTVDGEIRAAFFDGVGWTIQTVFSGPDVVRHTTGVTIELVLSDSDNAAIVASLDNRALPQLAGSGIVDVLGVAYFDGTTWVFADMFPGKVRFKQLNTEETGSILLADNDLAVLAFADKVQDAVDPRIIHEPFTVIQFNESGIVRRDVFGDEEWAYYKFSVAKNQTGDVGVVFGGGYNRSPSVRSPLFLFDGVDWMEYPAPAISPGSEGHFFLNDDRTAAAFTEEGARGSGFDGSIWRVFDEVPEHGRRRNHGAMARIGQHLYTYVSSFLDTATGIRYFEIYEYDTDNLQSSRILSDSLGSNEMRARVFQLDSGRVYLTEPYMKFWVEDLSGGVDGPVSLLRTEAATNSDVQINGSGFGVIADNTQFELTAHIIQVR